MTDAPADLSERLEALTVDQRQGLAALLQVAHALRAVSFSTVRVDVAVEAAALRDCATRIAESAHRLGKLTTVPDESGHELVLAHFELERQGHYWGVRSKLWGERIEVYVLDQPTRGIALAVALVQLARSVGLDGVLSDRHGRALTAFESSLGKACDELEDALYPDPPLAEKIAAARVRHERELTSAVPGEPDPSFHGTGGVD